MIKVEMTVSEAMAVAATCGSDLHDRIVSAFEVALGVNQRRKVTITRGMTTDNRIPCIKAIRLHSGWGLKESKDWTDVVIGHYNNCSRWVQGSGTNTITLKTPEAAEALLRDLTSLGCEGYLS